MAPSGPDDLYNEAGPRDGVHVRDFCPDMFDDDTPLRRPTSVRRCYRTGKSAKARSGSPARQGVRIDPDNVFFVILTANKA